MMSIYHSPDNKDRRPDLVGDLLAIVATNRIHQHENQATAVVGWLIDRSPEIGRAILELFLPEHVPPAGAIGARTQLSLPKKRGGFLYPDLSICVADHLLQLLVEVKIDAELHEHSDYGDKPQDDAYRQAWQELGEDDVQIRAVGTLTLAGAGKRHPDPAHLIARDVTWREVRDAVRDRLDAKAVNSECALIAESLVRAIDVRISPLPPDDPMIQDFFTQNEYVLNEINDAVARQIPNSGPAKRITGKHLRGWRLVLPSTTAEPLSLRLYLAPENTRGNLPGNPGSLLAGPERNTDGHLPADESARASNAGFKKIPTIEGWPLHAATWPLGGSTAPVNAEAVARRIVSMLAESKLIPT